jgi:hypothetical protein
VGEQAFIIKLPVWRRAASRASTTARRFCSTLTGSHAPYASSSACSSVNVFFVAASRASAASRRSCSAMRERTPRCQSRGAHTGEKIDEMRWGSEDIHTLRSGRSLGRHGRLHLCQFFLVFCPRLCRAIEAVLHLFRFGCVGRRTVTVTITISGPY